jgi:hypothetical protein
MDSTEMRREQRAQTVRDLGRMLQRQARGKWTDVRVASRSEPGHQVWRFRPGNDGEERFLHVSLEAIERAANSSRRLFRRLRKENWLSRMNEGGESSLRMGVDGRVAPYPTAL